MIYLISFIAAAFLFSYLTKKKTEDGYLKTVYKTDWHYKLIVWTFRSEPDFKKFCGYWWLAMFCFLCFPLTVLSYFVEWVIDSFSVIWTSKEENEVYRPAPIKIEKEVCEKQQVYVQKWTGYLRYLVKPFIILSAIGAAYLIYLIVGNVVKAISLSDLISAVIIVACVGAAAFIMRKAWEWRTNSTRSRCAPSTPPTASPCMRCCPGGSPTSAPPPTSTTCPQAHGR